tara:strand:- start:6415 stop:6666 length:252 start_codon:yes stop_codon:yes gene_type:complete
MSREIAEWCGYDSMSSMVLDNLSKIECIDLFCYFLDADFEGWSSEMVTEIATNKYDWVDHEQIRADADDAKMQEWKDRRAGDE